MGWIVLKDPDDTERWIEVPREGALICGRSRKADLVLADGLVSRRHASFLHRKGKDWVADAGASNGTFVNGSRLTGPHCLRAGDLVGIGPFELVYQLHAQVDGNSLDDTTYVEPTDVDPPDQASSEVGEVRSDAAGALPARAGGGRMEGSLQDTPRWRGVELIARGGMGEVYRAQDRDLGMTVAIKRLRHRGDGTGRLLERLHAREAAIGRTIQHPNVVQTLEDGVHKGDPYLLLDWIDGKTLDRYLDEERPSRSQCLEILRQVALGLHSAHRNAVVHADLKPSNLLVTPEPVEKEDGQNLGILVAPDQDAHVVDDTESDFEDELTREIRQRALDAVDLETPPFVGREAELELLAEAREESEGDGFRWVLIFGDRGVGKQRLANEFLARQKEGRPDQEAAIHVAEDWDPPPANAIGVWITLLPPLLPDDEELQTAYEQRSLQGHVYELHLQPFLRGQAIRLVEKIVNHPASSRSFVDEVLQETGGNAARLCAVLRRSFDDGAWVPSGGGYRFLPEVFLPDEKAMTRMLLEHFDKEEKGLRDLLCSAAPLGSCLDFETLREAIEAESASQFYILEHAIKAGYLARDEAGFYSFKLEPFRRVLESRLDSRRRQRVIARALPRLSRLLSRRDIPARLFREVASLERELDHLDRAFEVYLNGALRARNAYDREAFLTAVDEARDCYRKSAARRGSLKEISAVMGDLLGDESRGLSGIDRLRRQSCHVVVKITDFGIARRAEEGGGGRRKGKGRSRHGEPGAKQTDPAPWGTPRYMSPEQARREPLTPASDIFSLGILAREMLEDRHPLGPTKGKAAIEAIARGEIGPPTARPGDPPLLVELVRRILSPEPAQRPDAAEVAETLQKIQLRLAVQELRG